VAAVDMLRGNRLDELRSDPAPLIRAYDPPGDDPDDRLRRVHLGEALGRYSMDRSRLVERLRRLTRAEWQKSARHDEYNSYSVFTMFRHLALHDFFHAYRIEELLLRSDWPPPLAPVGDDDERRDT